MDTVLSSKTKTITIGSDKPFCIIGERINPTSRKKFSDELREGNLDTVVVDTKSQVEAGADMIFAEALKTLDEYREFTAALRVPVLANITDFGQTPLFTVTELRDAGVCLVIYPLSAFRAMSAAALAVYETLRRDGTQRAVVDRMQTRAELYDVLGYHDYERKLDELFARRS